MAASRLTIILSLICLSLPGTISSQLLNTSGPPDFLFVVETSLESAEYRENQITELARHISTGFNGRMLDGQTFTIWTADSSVDDSGFPITTWNSRRSDTLAAEATQFVESRKSTLPSDWMSAIRQIYSAIKGASHISVVINSIPGHPLRGTPFDNRIEYFLRENGKEMIIFKSPLITAVKGESGIITDLSVSSKNDPVELFEPEQSLFEMVGGTANPILNTPTQPLVFSKSPIIMRGDEILSLARPDPVDVLMHQKAVREAQDAIKLSSGQTPSREMADSSTATNDLRAVASMPNSSNSVWTTAQSSPDGILDVRAKEASSDEESEIEPQVASIPASMIGNQLYLSLGIASIFFAMGFFIIAMRLQFSRGPSLITEAFILNEFKKK